MKPINVGLLGLGTVGGGTLTVLRRNEAEITRRAGRAIRVKVAAVRDLEKAKAQYAGSDITITTDPLQVVDNPEIDIVVELIGGTDLAKMLVLKAIANGKHVVTANKALLATHGNEIFAAAQAKGVMVAFEAAVGGGIPIIKAVREGLAALQCGAFGPDTELSAGSGQNRTHCIRVLAPRPARTAVKRASARI